MGSEQSSVRHPRDVRRPHGIDEVGETPSSLQAPRFIERRLENPFGLGRRDGTNRCRVDRRSHQPHLIATDDCGYDEGEYALPEAYPMRFPHGFDLRGTRTGPVAHEDLETETDRVGANHDTASRETFNPGIDVRDRLASGERVERFCDRGPRC